MKLYTKDPCMDMDTDIVDPEPREAVPRKDVTRFKLVEVSDLRGKIKIEKEQGPAYDEDRQLYIIQSRNMYSQKLVMFLHRVLLVDAMKVSR